MNCIKSAGIKGIAHYVPEKILTNFDLEKIVDTSDEWIKTRTGIDKRRIASNDTATSDLAFEAARRVLINANLPPEEVDCIILATASPDTIFPSTACLVQDRLGVKKDAAAFDLSAGCTGFIYSLVVGAQMVASGIYQNILVIGAETLSKFLNWEDRNTCVLFGDGAGAVLLGPEKNGSGLLASHLGSDGSGSKMLCLPAGGTRLPASAQTIENKLHYIQMEGREVFKHAVRYMCDGVTKSLEKCNLTLNDIDYIIPHQANKRIINAISKRFKLREEQVIVNLDEYGNTSSASIPIALSELANSGKINKNDIVALTAFGAGYTWGGAIIKW